MRLLNFKKKFDKKKFYTGLLKSFDIDPPLPLSDGRSDWEIRLKRSLDRVTYEGLVDAWTEKTDKLEKERQDQEKQ